MFLRACELSALGLFTICGIADSATGANTEPFLQYGALGLVGFMVLQNYRQHRDTCKVVREKDQLLQKQNERIARLVAEQTEAAHRLAEVLEDRSRIAKDKRIQEEKHQCQAKQ